MGQKEDGREQPQGLGFGAGTEAGPEEVDGHDEHERGPVRRVDAHEALGDVGGRPFRPADIPPVNVEDDEAAQHEVEIDA